MTIRIECEAHELGDLLSRVDQQSAERGAAVEENRVLREKVYDLEDQIRRLKSDLSRSLQNPPSPHYAPKLRMLVTAVASGQKIAAIKEIKEMAGLGLKEAKDLFEEAFVERIEFDPAVGGYVTRKPVAPAKNG